MRGIKYVALQKLVLAKSRGHLGHCVAFAIREEQSMQHFWRSQAIPHDMIQDFLIPFLQKRATGRMSGHNRKAGSGEIWPSRYQLLGADMLTVLSAGTKRSETSWAGWGSISVGTWRGGVKCRPI